MRQKPITSLKELQELPLLMDTQETARVLGNSPRAVRYLCANGEIKSVRIGREWRINRDALIEYMGL